MYCLYEKYLNHKCKKKMRYEHSFKDRQMFKYGEFIRIDIDKYPLISVPVKIIGDFYFMMYNFQFFLNA